ncbi:MULTISPECIES: hypothetical protein [Streptomyces]|uniref:B box-type domain-containing protein n=2 Tax=Streptomyces TaxID=1883 RepID=A0ABV9J6T5_9ACTN
MTTAERLLARLREAGLDLPEGSRLDRVYPSRAMRTEGAWSWAAFGPGGRELRIGSQYSMTQLLQADALDVAPIQSGAVGKDIDVIPAKACQRCRSATTTGCRICHAPLCGSCFTDHHHEGYGTPTD